MGGWGYVVMGGAGRDGFWTHPPRKPAPRSVDRRRYPGSRPAGGTGVTRASATRTGNGAHGGPSAPVGDPAWRNRIVGSGEEAPDQLVANPQNWRVHPGNQRDALRGSLATVGWVQQVLVNRRTGHVVDEHARVEEALSRNEASVPVLYVDLDYHWRHETVMYGWRNGAAHYFNGGRTQDTVWEIPRPKRSEEHPTMKPVGLVERAVENSTHPGGLIYDPFLGSGTTIIAAEQLNRRCYAMEIDPRYVAVAIERWEKFTGKTSERIDG